MYLTEFEEIQLIGNNDLSLTVAYHDPYNRTTNLTVMNRIYRVTW
nr:helveticin J family class III bacteriocin [Lactobacillus sp.]